MGGKLQRGYFLCISLTSNIELMFFLYKGR
jgi:hypothetical protein